MEFTKKKGISPRIRFVVLSALLLLLTHPAWAYEYILVSNPLFHKMPLGFSEIDFFPEQQAMVESYAGKAMGEIRSMLLFAGYFNEVPVPAASGFAGSVFGNEESVDFPAWQKAQAELLVDGHASMQGDKLRLDLYLYDVTKKKRLIGKRYEAAPEHLRTVSRRFCTAVIETLTNTGGFFNSRIVFVQKKDGKKDLVVCDFDGSFPEPLTRDGYIKASPDWSSDGKYLAFTSYEKGGPDLCIRPYAGGPEVWVRNPGLNITPAWLPGRFELAATLSLNNDQDIYLLTGQGKLTKRLTNRWGIDVSPGFSPDGQQMVFVSNRGGSPQIYIQELDSGQVRRLTYEGKYNTSPSWSPDGKRIAFSGMVEGRNHIFIIHADGTGLMQLTDGDGDNETPSWSPDGSHIVFASSREGGQYRIYIMSAFGTDQRRLLDFPGEQLDPCWSPNVFY